MSVSRMSFRHPNLSGHKAARSPRPARGTNIPRRKHVRDHQFQDRQSFDDYDSWASCLSVGWKECQVLRLLSLCVDGEACATPACSAGNSRARCSRCENGLLDSELPIRGTEVNLREGSSHQSYVAPD